MSRASIYIFAAMICSVGPACAQVWTQDSLNNIAIVVGGGSRSSVSVTQSGFTNLYYGVQEANNQNQAIVSQNGLFGNVAQSTQVNDAGRNIAFVTQNSPDNHSEIVQMGRNNVAGVMQNPATGAATPRWLIPSDGPSYASSQTQDGYLSLFTTDNFSLAFVTPPGLTATSSFYRMH
jgi:minor curlin subunit